MQIVSLGQEPRLAITLAVMTVPRNDYTVLLR